MAERPSFQNRADVRRLVIALLTPWVLFGLAYSLPLLGRELYRSGFHQTGWLGPVVMIWFYSFAFPALVSGIAWFGFGVWRLAWRPEYRRSWYGWLWLFLMWVNICLVGSIIGH